MNRKELLLNEINRIPEPLIDEALDFIRFLKSKIKNKKQKDTAILSVTSLKKDWLKSEENKAWENL
ncbi:MAG: DUF2281 domain-containing protein [Elusimicrobia bacterium CG06_land_8_20_14_3_00_38_11]|nr:MAG: DUF2281 domain-containing protein [Elusimicrobia bacterium CG06_land_8_20_14_3_00_38_11]